MRFTDSSEKNHIEGINCSTRAAHKGQGLGEADVESIAKTVTANQNPIQTNVIAV